MATSGGRSKSYSKKRGYNVEVQAVNALLPVFPRLRRVGSPAYTKNAPDLVQDGEGPVLPLVVTKDLAQPLLVTLSLEDFNDLMSSIEVDCSVAVQVKAREHTWIGRLWRDLVEAVSKG